MSQRTCRLYILLLNECFAATNTWMFGHPWRWKQALQWNVASQRKTMTKFRAEKQKCRRVTFQHHLYLAVSPTCWRSSSSSIRSLFYQTSFCYNHCIPLEGDPRFAASETVIIFTHRQNDIKTGLKWATTWQWRSWPLT